MDMQERMKYYYVAPTLFKGMTFMEIDDALFLLRAHEQAFSKGELILHAGDTTPEMGIVIEGSVTIESCDILGNRTILGLVEADDFFAESYAIFGDEPLLVDVRANENCRVLFLRIADRLQPSEYDTDWRIKFLNNLVRIASRKNIALSSRAFHTAPKTVRERIMAYLESVSIKKGNTTFDIPFSRQQLADYLNVDRTSLSKELSRMQRDGLIEYHLSSFRILKR